MRKCWNERAMRKMQNCKETACRLIFSWYGCRYMQYVWLYMVVKQRWWYHSYLMLISNGGLDFMAKQMLENGMEWFGWNVLAQPWRRSIEYGGLLGMYTYGYKWNADVADAMPALPTARRLCCQRTARSLMGKILSQIIMHSRWLFVFIHLL